MRLSLPLATILAILLLGFAAIWILDSGSDPGSDSTKPSSSSSQSAPDLAADQEPAADVIDRDVLTNPGTSGLPANETERGTVQVQVLAPDGTGVEGVVVILFTEEGVELRKLPGGNRVEKSRWWSSSERIISIDHVPFMEGMEIILYEGGTHLQLHRQAISLEDLRKGSMLIVLD